MGKDSRTLPTMPLGTALAQAASGESSPWLAVILAALASSALGAVVGGLLTTWYRNRLEREEAWRTRLIEAADDFAVAQHKAIGAFHEALYDLASRPQGIRTDDGHLTPWAKRTTATASETVGYAATLVSRLDLLFGPDSAVARDALRSIGDLRLAMGLAWKGPETLKLAGLEHADYSAIMTTARGLGGDAGKSLTDYCKAASAQIWPKRRTPATPAEPDTPGEPDTPLAPDMASIAAAMKYQQQQQQQRPTSRHPQRG